jgi:hypothetical protein
VEAVEAVEAVDLSALKAERATLHTELYRTLDKLKLARASSQAAMRLQHSLNKKLMDASTEHARAVQDHKFAIADEVQCERAQFETMTKLWRLDAIIDQAEADRVISASTSKKNRR